MTAARLRITPFHGVLASEGGHREGFLVRGTDRIGREISIFVFTREAAEATRRAIISGRGQIVFGSPS